MRFLLIEEDSHLSQKIMPCLIYFRSLDKVKLGGY
jgi:hypothetical protein